VRAPAPGRKEIALRWSLREGSERVASGRRRPLGSALAPRLSLYRRQCRDSPSRIIVVHLDAKTGQRFLNSFVFRAYLAMRLYAGVAVCQSRAQLFIFSLHVHLPL
jgi:hypothetical protein